MASIAFFKKQIHTNTQIHKLQCAAWITRVARVHPQGHAKAVDADTQVVLNDTYRTLLGYKRADHITVSELATRASMPTLNELVVRGAAMAAWKASVGSPLSHMLAKYDERSRASAAGLLRPCSINNIGAVNMAVCLTASVELRAASTLAEARRAAYCLASKCRMY